MLFRSWLAFCIVIGVLQLVLGTLLVLQHDAVLSDLLRQRISVMAQTTAASFKPIIDLGLPISMIRNGDTVVARALQTDPKVRAVHAFNPSGIIVYSTDPAHSATVPREVLRAMRLSGTVKWSVETAEQIYSGFNVVRRDSDVSGAVVVAYPKDGLQAASGAIIEDVARTGLFVWTAFSMLSYVLLRLLMKRPEQRLQQLEALAVAGGDIDEPLSVGPAPRAGFWRGLFEPELRQLGLDLSAARRRYAQAERELAALAVPQSNEAIASPEIPPGASQPPEAEIAANPSRSLARRIAAHLAPVAAVLIIASALLMAFATLDHVKRSIEPELAARTNLIATLVGEDVERAVAAGVPLDKLVDAETYFSDMLKQLPEIAYVAIATGRVVLEAGKRIDPYLAPPRERKDVRSHPIMHNGEEIAYVVIDVDPALIAKKFIDVFLDIGVVLLVATLVAFEILVLLSSRSLTAALDRLQRIASLQSAADFSKKVVTGTRTAVDRACAELVRRAETLNASFAVLWTATAVSAQRRTQLSAFKERFRLAPDGPSLLRLSYFTDLRLALFLFAAADEMPLSFMPLYTRAAYNPFPWAPESLLISLPLAGYLLAIVLVSPFARPLARWLGPRQLLILAALPTVAAHLWLHFAGSVPEIVAARTVLGIGYAFITLACQDYVIDNTPREERDRSLGVFSTVLFGGIFCGTALGGVLADRLGQANVFLLSAVLVAISAVLIFSLVAETGERTAGRLSPPARTPVFAALRSRYFAALVFGIAIPVNVMLQAFLSYLVALTLDSLGATPADIARTLMVGLIAIGFVGPAAGRLVERGIPAWAVVLSGALLSVAALFVAVPWQSQASVFIAVLGVGIGEGLIRGSQVSIALAIAETELVHLGPDPVLGALRASERFGSIVGLVLVALVAGYFGFAVATAATAAVALIGAVAFGLTLLSKLAAAGRQPAR